MEKLYLAGINTGSCVGDVAQDLLVFSGKNPDSIHLDCFIYSLAKGGLHPDAARSRISSSIDSDDWPDYQSLDSVQVLGELVAWNVPDSELRRCEMRVINWKTGVTVWEFHNELWWRCRLISESHVVVVTFESLLVYPIDRHRQTPSAHSTKDTAPCVLQLPAWSSISGSRHLLIQSHIQFPPPLGPHDRPLNVNRPDPDLTLLALDIHYIVEAPLDREPELVQHAMFIPVSTIKTHIDSARVSG
ncbi:hypothetical protein V8D89_011197 [Ganoderma adspersum]